MRASKKQEEVTFLRTKSNPQAQTKRRKGFRRSTIEKPEEYGKHGKPREDSHRSDLSSRFQLLERMRPEMGEKKSYRKNTQKRATQPWRVKMY